MRPSRQLLEHPLGVARVLRLRVEAPAEHDGRVDTEHRPAVRLVRDGARLPERVGANELLRVGLGRIVLLVARRDGVERNAELVQDRPPLRRGRREQERRRRRNAPRLAGDPDLLGGPLAHSTVT